MCLRVSAKFIIFEMITCMQALIVAMSEVRLEHVAWGHFPTKYDFQYLLLRNHHLIYDIKVKCILCFEI